jgi:hypothetical protein
MTCNRCRYGRHAIRSLEVTLACSVAVMTAAGFSGGAARSQEQRAKPRTAVAARPDDVKSIDTILAALYDTISGPAGGRDWDRLRSLFYAGARLIPCGKVPQNQGGGEPAVAAHVLTVEEFIKRAEPGVKAQGFLEREIARRVERFGAIAHVFSTYESRHAASDPQPFVRGINSIQLFFDGSRWSVVTIFWDSERAGQSIPEEYLPKR